jgi:hypothetical protein
MNAVIEQTIFFENSTAEELFDIFLDAKKHSEILGGADVKITKNEGDRFTCLNGLLRGKNLMIVPNRMIVQSWRGDVWNEDELDSVLTLTFTTVNGGAEIYMVHANTVDRFTERWNDVYWKPIKKYLPKVKSKNKNNK